MNTIDALQDTPRFNIKTVSAETGVMPVTLRAWERRYNILAPHRTRSNYRLYSEQDVAVLRWLKSQVDKGTTISEAAAELTALRTRGLWPEAVGPRPAPANPSTQIVPAKIAEQLYHALLHQDEAQAGRLLAEADSQLDLTTVCLEVIAPCLIRFGDAWHRGEILISTEHLASNYLLGRLTTLFQSFPNRRGAPYIIVACSANDQHEIGSLMLATLLRREGYRVEYLGVGIPNEDLVDFVKAERPDLLCLSASSAEMTADIINIHRGLTDRRLKTKLGYGGRAFVLNPKLSQGLPGTFLGHDVREAQISIRQLLESH